MKQTLKTLKYWDGYISQDGTFYKQKKWDNYRESDDFATETLAHDRLVIDAKRKLDHLSINENIRCMTYDEVLINLLGYIGYRIDGEKVEIMYPDYITSNYSITKEQLETLLAVVKLNNVPANEKFFVRERKYT